jgi:hypothetical protein
MGSEEEANFAPHDSARVEGLASRRSEDRDFGTGLAFSDADCGTAAANSRAASQIVYICIAADLLRQMMMELQRAELNNARLEPAIAAARQDIRQRLDLLLAIIESLVAAENPTRATYLGRRAKLMICRLAGEIEQLAIQTQGVGQPLIAEDHSEFQELMPTGTARRPL